MQQLLGAVHGNQEAMDAFVSITAGTLSPEAFFDPAHIGSLMGRGGPLNGPGQRTRTRHGAAPKRRPVSGYSSGAGLSPPGPPGRRPPAASTR